ncbi:MAG: hypothetical protein ACLUVC_10530 [Longibaculum sp.]
MPQFLKSSIRRQKRVLCCHFSQFNGLYKNLRAHYHFNDNQRIKEIT